MTRDTRHDNYVSFDWIKLDAFRYNPSVNPFWADNYYNNDYIEDTIST